MIADAIVRALLACAVFAAVPALSAEHVGNVVNDDAYGHPQHRVKVDHDRHLNLYCLGTGSPTVVFDAGLADATMVWGLVQPAIAAETRSCTYDRAGIGFSDPANRAGTSANIADDLHRLLTIAGIKPPYVLVGHSSGGMNVRLYADQFPTEVVGMVLVDPSHEDQSTRFWKLAGPDAKAKWDQHLIDRRACVAAARSGFNEGAQLEKDAALYADCVTAPDSSFSAPLNAAILKTHLTPAFQQALLSEQENVFYASADQVRDARRSYGDMPLVVLTRSAAPRGPDETQELRDTRNLLWQTLHDELAALSTRGINRIVPDSRHYIQLSQPQAVNAAILEVLAAANASGRSGN